MSDANIPFERKTILVCSACGSPEVVIDAWVHANTGDTNTYDGMQCEPCGYDGNHFDEVSLSETGLYELTLPGFNAEDDRTDDRILWVKTGDLYGLVTLAHEHAKGTVIEPLDPAVNAGPDTDFLLPEHESMFVQRLRRAAQTA